MVEEGDLDDVDEEAVRDEVKNCYYHVSISNQYQITQNINFK
jgi:hypothetical protein